jgi:hypothetical protein
MTDDTGRKLQLKVDDVVWREVEDELVVLELSTSTYVTLNGSAKFLWETLADGSTLDKLVSSLVGRYSISPEQARSDIEAFIAALDERELIAHEA